MMTTMKEVAIGLALGALALLAGCDSTGTCEFTYDEASKDSSIQPGPVCLPKTLPTDCNANAMKDVAMGLKTSGFTFTKGAKCEERGFKDCPGGHGIILRKDCPK